MAIDEATELGASPPQAHGRAIASSTLWQVASQLVMAVLSVVTLKFLTIGLSKELVGYYNSAYGYLQTFAILADFGLYAVSLREISRAADKERTFGALFVLRTLILVLSFGAAIVFAWLLPRWQGTPFPIGVTIASLVPTFTLLAGMIRTVFQIHYQMKFVFVAEVLQRIVTTFGIGLIILLSVRGSTSLLVYESTLWIGGVGAFLLFAVSYLYAGQFMRIRFCFDRALIVRMATLAAPYGITYLLLTLYRQIDVVFIALLRSDFALQNAAYGLSGRVEDMAFLLPTFLLNSVLPVLSNPAEAQRHRRLLGRTFLFLLVIGSALLLYSYVWAQPLTLLFATRAYLTTPDRPGADMAFMLMSVPMFLNGIVLYCFYVFLARHQWRRLMASFGIGVILTIFLNLLWTPSQGFVGAAWALIVTHVLLALLLLPQALREQPMSITASELLRWLVFSVLLGGFLWLVRGALDSALMTVLAGGISGLWMVFLAWVTGLHQSFSPSRTTSGTL